MTQHILNRCNQCGYVTVYEHCPNNPAHRVRALSIAESNNYVRIGHDAFRELPEPEAKPCPVNPEAVEAFKLKHGAS